MKLIRFINVFMFGLLASSPLRAATQNLPGLLQNNRPLISLFGGAAVLNPSQTQAYSGTDSTQFIYNNQTSRNTFGFAGVFLGAEHAWSSPRFFTQSGVEYTQFAGNNVNAQHSVGDAPATSTVYKYHYHFQSRQFLLKVKILSTLKQRFHPYISLGAGPALNTLGNFKATTAETGSINLTPTFGSKTQTAFSYSFGLGLDTTVTSHVRVGVGYQFTNLGSASLGSGNILLGGFSVATPFTLRVSPLYANEVFAQLTYLI